MSGCLITMLSKDKKDGKEIKPGCYCLCGEASELLMSIVLACAVPTELPVWLQNALQSLGSNNFFTEFQEENGFQRAKKTGQNPGLGTRDFLVSTAVNHYDFFACLVLICDIFYLVLCNYSWGWGTENTIMISFSSQNTMATYIQYLLDLLVAKITEGTLQVENPYKTKMY